MVRHPWQGLTSWQSGVSSSLSTQTTSSVGGECFQRIQKPHRRGCLYKLNVMPLRASPSTDHSGLVSSSESRLLIFSASLRIHRCPRESSSSSLASSLAISASLRRPHLPKVSSSRREATSRNAKSATRKNALETHSVVQHGVSNVSITAMAHSLVWLTRQKFVDNTKGHNKGPYGCEEMIDE